MTKEQKDPAVPTRKAVEAKDINAILESGTITKTQFDCVMADLSLDRAKVLLQRTFKQSELMQIDLLLANIDANMAAISRLMTRTMAGVTDKGEDAETPQEK